MSIETANNAPYDAGGPAKRLALAPPELRCQKVLNTEGGGSGTRCSRFTLKKADGSRDNFCIAHSESEQAAALRSKAAKAQEEARLAERKRRESILDQILPFEWSQVSHFNYGRFWLFRCLVLGDLTVEEVRELRALTADAERSAQTKDYDWRGDFLR